MGNYESSNGAIEYTLTLNFSDRSEAQGTLKYLRGYYKHSGTTNGKNPEIKLIGRVVHLVNAPSSTIDDVIDKVYSRVSSRVSHKIQPTS